MKVRLLQKHDLPALAMLYRQFWNEDSDLCKMEQQFDVLKKVGSHIVLVCEKDGAIIGSVMGVVCPEFYGDCDPFLVVENMIVDRTCRRSGVGKVLLSKLEELAKERNCTQMILVTEKNRLDACGFYEAYGFQTNTTGYKKKL